MKSIVGPTILLSALLAGCGGGNSSSGSSPTAVVASQARVNVKDTTNANPYSTVVEQLYVSFTLTRA